MEVESLPGDAELGTEVPDVGVGLAHGGHNSRQPDDCPWHRCSLNQSSILGPANGVRPLRCDSRFQPIRRLVRTRLGQRPREVVCRDAEGDQILTAALETRLAAD